MIILVCLCGAADHTTGNIAFGGYFSPFLVETRQEDKLCYKKIEINSLNKRRVKGQKVAMPTACPSFCPFSSTTEWAETIVREIV